MALIRSSSVMISRERLGSRFPVNVDENLKKLEDDNEFLAYIDEAYTDAQIQDLIARVKAVDNVDGASVKFVTKEEAKAAYLRPEIRCRPPAFSGSRPRSWPAAKRTP